MATQRATRPKTRQSMTRTVLKILWKCLLGILTLIYVAIALANYSVVQSLAGSVASDKLSEGWGGTIRIGSMGVNLLGQATLHDVLLVTPHNDTIGHLGRVAVRFRNNPLQPDGLHLGHATISRSYFHLQETDNGLTIVQMVDYLIQRFASEKEPEPDSPTSPFVVHIDQVTARHIHYKQTLTPTGNMQQAVFKGQRPIDIPNLDFTDVSFKCRNLRVDGAHVTLRMDRFSAQEASGMNVRSLKMNVYVAPDGISATDMALATDSSRIYCDVLMQYDGFGGFSHFFDSVLFCVNVKEGTLCNLHDAAYWGHVLWGMNEHVAFSGQVHGPLGNFEARNMTVRLGQRTQLDFDGTMQGLPNIENTTLNVRVSALRTSYDDLAAVRWGNSLKVSFPQVLAALGDINATAFFEGGLRNCHATLAAHTAPGDLAAEASLHYDDEAKAYAYEAHIASPDFMVQRVAANEWLTRTGFAIDAKGTGFSPATMRAEVSGKLANGVLRGVALDDATLKARADNGIVSALIELRDTLANGSLWASANLRDSVKDYEIGADLLHMDLARLHLWQRPDDTNATLSTHLQAHLAGNTLETVHGSCVLDDTRLTLNGTPVNLRSAAITVRSASPFKSITLASPVANASLRGYFAYADLPLVARRLGQQYLPRYYAPAEQADSLFAPLDDDYIDIDVTWTDTLDAMAPLMGSLMLAPGTQLHAVYNYAEQLKMVARSDSIGIATLVLHDIGLRTGTAGDRYSVDLSAQRVALGGSPLQENVQVVAAANNDGMGLHWLWDNRAADTTRRNNGDINIEMQSSDTANIVRMGPSVLNIGPDSWRLRSASPIIFHDSVFRIDDIEAVCARQAIRLQAWRNHDTSDYASVDLTNFQLNHLAPLLASSGLTIGGSVNGAVRVRDFTHTPRIGADLRVDSALVGDQPLGTMRLRSNWDAAGRQVNLLLTTALNSAQGTLSPITASGTLSLREKGATGLDFEVLFDGFNLQILQPLAQDVASELGGALRGAFSIQGTTQNPEIRGTAYFDGGAAKLAATGVRYTFNDSVTFNDSSIVFSHFTLHDPDGGVALLNGAVMHDRLHDMALNLTLQSEKMALLSTTPKDGNYYGTVNASIDGRVRGPLDNIDVVVRARTLPGSHVVAQIDQQKQVTEAGYIQFVQPTDAFEGRRPRQEETSAGRYHLTVELDVTPDLRLNFPLDYSEVGAQVEATGHGELELTLGSSAPLSLIGNYVFNEGAMEVSLLGLLSKKFTVEEGSTINFPGDPAKASFDITALFTQRVNLSTLTGTLSSNNSQQLVEVQNVIAVNGTIDDPAIHFDIRLPNADQTLQEEVFSYIDRTSERDMLNQTFSLLMMKSFYSTASGPTQNATSSGSSLIANSIGSVVSDMVEFVDINFDVTSGTELTTDQVLMNVNKSWGKVYFESAFGFGGEARDVQSVNTGNNLIGDMLLGYKISPRFHVYVFNRSNTNDYTRSDLPFKQGVGAKYSRDFARWRDLFKKNKRKKGNE